MKFQKRVINDSGLNFTKQVKVFIFIRTTILSLIQMYYREQKSTEQFSLTKISTELCIRTEDCYCIVLITFTVLVLESKIKTSNNSSDLILPPHVPLIKL